jgi:hypothetical protein
MGKKRSKSELLEQILAELSKLKADIKALGKQQAALVEKMGKPAPRKAARPARKPAKRVKQPAPAAARKGATAPKRPVLVAPPQAPAA